MEINTPEILDLVAAGTHPIAFTSEWFKTRQLPTDWDDQRGIVAALWNSSPEHADVQKWSRASSATDHRDRNAALANM